MKASHLTTIAGLVIIGTGGFMAGRISSPEPGSAGNDHSAEPKSTRASFRPAADSSRESAARPRRTDRADRIPGTSTERLARLESIVRGEDPLDRGRALLAFIDQLGPDEFEEAVASFRSLGITESRFGEYGLLLAGWAKLDPMAALAYTTENTSGSFANNTVLSTWASTDPEGAIRWAEATHEGDDANPYLAGIIRSLASTDPTRATQLLTGMPKSTERGEALNAMLPHLLTQGNEATRAWISAITDDSLRNGAMTRVATKLAETDPAGTAAWLAANPSEATQRRMDDVYRTWASQDQQAALSSLASLPSGENRTNALRGLVTSVAVSDPQAAVSMLDRFPNDVNDRVVQNLVWHSFRSEPGIAVAQISRIADERQRDRTYNRLLQAWTERDPAAAGTWIQSNPLPPSVQERLNR